MTPSRPGTNSDMCWSSVVLVWARELGEARAGLGVPPGGWPQESAGLIQPCWHNIPVDRLPVILGTLAGWPAGTDWCVRIIPVEASRHSLEEAEAPADPAVLRSEERRVGKECRCG